MKEKTTWCEALGESITGVTIESVWEDAKRYQWLRDNVFDVLCEGRPEKWQKKAPSTLKH